VVAASTASLRVRRGLAALRLVARGGARYASSAPRLFAAAGEHRQRLRNDLALQTAEDVATTLGAMKGVLMKLGQMASYVDDGLSPAVRRTLSRLQDSVPPMSADLAAQVVREELGVPPERAFARWDPEPIAAASIPDRSSFRGGVALHHPALLRPMLAPFGDGRTERRPPETTTRGVAYFFVLFICSRRSWISFLRSSISRRRASLSALSFDLLYPHDP